MQQISEHAASRRQLLRVAAAISVGLAAGLIAPSEVFGAEWDGKAFDAKSVQDALKALGGSNFAESKEVNLIAPDIAENGAVVPVGVASSVPNTELIAILVDKNPNTLSGVFSIPAGTEPQVNTRIKMSGTATVHALVKAKGRWLMASKEVKVTLGGCGG
ncbi:MAG: thiosulfate oxidation carrier protein SoxY [Burkholderiales bacterium]|nr:thiosulfate oxidation carrier protein SoxY [Burkholderiales bacterium]